MITFEEAYCHNERCEHREHCIEYVSPQYYTISGELNYVGVIEPQFCPLHNK